MTMKDWQNTVWTPGKKGGKNKTSPEATSHETNFRSADKFYPTLRSHGTVQYFCSVRTAVWTARRLNFRPVRLVMSERNAYTQEFLNRSKISPVPCEGSMTIRPSLGGRIEENAFFFFFFWRKLRAQLFQGRLALNPGFSFLCSKAFTRIIFSVIFRAANHQLVDEKN